ncbi:MAG: hypothetical protein AUK31_01695 [Fibrobacteres bacterium CG2_30_45_31]|nr:MAG: hypothetical protein AUK31_01695 [Fibrobacteres bacterium CG2_30_45_31]
MSQKINLFISHYGGDEDAIPKFKELLSRQDYDIRDSSIVESEPNNANNEDYIKSLLRRQIEWAGKIVVLISPKTAKRDWVNWELEYAAKSGTKRIIGVYLRGATDSDVPNALNDYGDALVAWNLDSIASAIEGANIWQDSTGNARPSVASPRETC